MLSGIATDQKENADPLSGLTQVCPPASSANENGAMLVRPATIKSVDPSAWEHTAAGFEDVRQEQLHCFCASRWGAHNLEHVIVEHNGFTIAGAAVIVLLVPATKLGIAIVKWGPLWRRRGQSADIAHLRTALRLLKQEYADGRGLFLSILPQVDPDNGDDLARELKALGSKDGSRLQYPDRYFVNTSIPAQDLLASLDHKWRYNLKKSRKESFEFKWARGGEHLQVFMDLYNQMLARKQFHDTSAIATLAPLAQTDIETHQPSILLVYHDGKPTAGAVIDTSGDCAVYLYGATDDRALPLRVGYAMHWWIAEWLCENPHIRWYDLGGCDGDHGLHQFKKGFVGKKGRIMETPAAADIYNTPFSTALAKSVFAIRDIKGLALRTFHRALAGVAR